MSNIISRISKRAKAIRRIHPSKKWQDCIKQASREIKSGSPKKSPRKKVSGVKSKTRKKAVRKLAAAHKREGKIIRSLGSVSSHVSQAKKILKDEIAWNQASILTAKSAKTKRNLRKMVAKKLSLYRKLD